MPQTRITPSYKQLRSLYLASLVRDGDLKPGRVTVLLTGDDEFSAEGSLSPQGYLSGMAKLYKKLGLEDGSVVQFQVKRDDTGQTLVVTSPVPTIVPVNTEGGAVQQQTVFEQRTKRHIHYEPFRPENLNCWEPEGETDVYLAFGVLQEYTDFIYCCSTSQAVLNALGADYQETAKPDAILIDRSTGEYLMAEWKKNSSEYKTNHAPDDVDVLICWFDNEADQSKLPSRVLALHSVAKTAAETVLANIPG